MTTDPYPPELRAAYNRLINTKLRVGLSAAEEIELLDVCAQINACDRQSGRLEDYERAASFVERDLADLRREIEALPQCPSFQGKK